MITNVISKIHKFKIKQNKEKCTLMLQQNKIKLAKLIYLIGFSFLPIHFNFLPPCTV